MWLTLKIGVFYGAPILAVVLALAWFVVLVLRVRQGRSTRLGAARDYGWTLLLPVMAVLSIWLTGEAAGYFSSTLDQYAWNPDISLELLRGLLPLGFYVGAVVFALHVLLWMTLPLIRVRH